MEYIHPYACIKANICNIPFFPCRLLLKIEKYEKEDRQLEKRLQEMEFAE